MSLRSSTIIALSVTGVLLAGCGPKLPWRRDWKEAMIEARDNRQDMLLLFDAATCPRCMHMDSEVFKDERVQEELATYQLIRVDILWNRDLADRYGVTGTPSFVVLNSVGRVLGKHAGTLGPAEMIRFLRGSRMKF